MGKFREVHSVQRSLNINATETTQFSPTLFLRPQPHNGVYFLPDRKALLNVLKSLLPRNPICAEIGSWRGNFALEIHQILQPGRLVITDLWAESSDDRYKEGNMDIVERIFKNETLSGSVQLLKGSSLKTISELPNELHFAYLDTTHFYLQTARELELLASHILAGGFLCGHDYTHAFGSGSRVGYQGTSKAQYGVIEAVHEFLLHNQDFSLMFVTEENSLHASFCLTRDITTILGTKANERAKQGQRGSRCSKSFILRLQNASRLERASYLNEIKLHREVAKTPSMMSGLEVRFLFGLARYHFCGLGNFFEAGLFLGASTVAFGLGLSLPPAGSGKVLESYDQFIADTIMAEKITSHYPKVRLRPGESFASIYTQNTQSVAHLQDLYIGDIGTALQTRSGPLEIVFLDVLKTQSLVGPVMRGTLPRMIPGHSVLIHQDFMHENLPWIHVSMGVLTAFFEHVITLPCCTVAFLNTKPVPEETLRRLDSLSKIPLSKQLSLFDSGVAMVPDLEPQYAFTICMAKILLIELRVENTKDKNLEPEGGAFWMSQAMLILQVCEDNLRHFSIEPPGNHTSARVYHRLSAWCRGQAK